MFLKIPHTNDKNPSGTLILKAGHLSDPLKFQDSLTKELKKKGVKKIFARANSFELTENKIKNVVTGEESFMVQQRVTAQGTNKVYYKEQSDADVQENASTM